MTAAPEHSALHRDAHSVLTNWVGPDAHQQQLRSNYLAHLNANGDAMQRSCFPAHLTAGVLVISEDAGQVLLNLHGKARRWFAFGGHCEAEDHTLAGVALREGLEESGLAALELDPIPVDLDSHTVEFCDPRGSVDHLDVRFTARASSGAIASVSAESLAVRWWPIDALPDDLETEMRTLITRSVQRWTQTDSTLGPPVQGRSNGAMK